MSRTFKDRRTFTTDGTLKRRTALPKDFFDYSSSPSWWNHMTTTIPRRRENRIYEAIVKTARLDDLDMYEPYLNWNKPQQYYW